MLGRDTAIGRWRTLCMGMSIHSGWRKPTQRDGSDPVSEFVVGFMAVVWVVIVVTVFMSKGK